MSNVAAAPEIHLASQQTTVWAEDLDDKYHARHRSPHNGSYQKELRHTNDALKWARRGSDSYIKVLRILRPESHAPAPLFSWSHRTLVIKDNHQLSINQLAQLRTRYIEDSVAEMSAEQQEFWRNSQGMAMAIKNLDVPASHKKGRNTRNNHCMYGIAAVNAFAKASFMAPENDQKFMLLAETLSNYDNLRLARNLLEEKVEAIASRTIIHRIFMLGCSAAQTIYRLATMPVTLPVLYLHTRSKIRQLESVNIRNGRRWALSTQLSLAALAVFTIYKFHKTGLHWLPDNNHVIAGDIDISGNDNHAPLPIETDQPWAPPDVDSFDQTGGHITFNQDAMVTTNGEGWMSQLTQMKIKYSPAFMNKIGPWLAQKGYAYKYFDTHTGQWGWGMTKMNIDQSTLEEIYSKAKEQGIIAA